MRSKCLFLIHLSILCRIDAGPNDRKFSTIFGDTNSPDEENKNIFIVGGAAGAAFFVIIILIVSAFVLYKKKEKSSRQFSEDTKPGNHRK